MRARRKKVYPIPPPVSSGKCGFWKFAGILIPRKLRKQVRPVFALLSTADEIARGVVRVMFAVMRRPDGGSPCDGRGAVALPSVAASCDPPFGRDKRGSAGIDVACVHPITSQWPPFLNPTRRMSFWATNVPTAILIVSLLSPSLVAKPRIVIVPSFANS